MVVVERGAGGWKKIIKKSEDSSEHRSPGWFTWPDYLASLPGHGFCPDVPQGIEPQTSACCFRVCGCDSVTFTLVKSVYFIIIIILSSCVVCVKVNLGLHLCSSHAGPNPNPHPGQLELGLLATNEECLTGAGGHSGSGRS